jgi:hypothetical protein
MRGIIKNDSSKMCTEFLRMTAAKGKSTREKKQLTGCSHVIFENPH